jgi:hypothetical protein
MSRSLESRIGRLEQSSGVRDPNRVFVMWCRPDQDEDAVLQAAADQGLFGTNEKRMVECCHWKGSGPIPKPRWTTWNELCSEELRYMIDSDKAGFVRDGLATADEMDELEREMWECPGDRWDPSTSRVVARMRRC